MPEIDLNFLFALITFYFVMYVTPGPNNSMILASGLRFGFIKSIPHMLGITIGHIFQLIIVCLGFGKVFQLYPELQTSLKIICVLYLIYLSYQIIGSFEKITSNDGRPLNFSEAAFFQLINPKAWTICSLVASGFLKANISLLASILLIAAIALIICPLSIAPWAAFGSIIRKRVKNKKIKILVEYLLAILLFTTSILVLFGL